MKPDLIENGMLTLHGKRHSITLDETSWLEIKAKAFGPGGDAWARRTAFERSRDVQSSTYLTEQEKLMALRHAWALHTERQNAANKAARAAAEARLQRRVAISIENDCPTWRVKDDFTIIPDDELSPIQRYALAHDVDPNELEVCADCECVMETHNVDTWRELFGSFAGSMANDSLLPEHPNQEACRTEPLCKACGEKHVIAVQQLEAERNSDRKRGERIAERYNISNGSGWNNHATARGIKDAIFEGQAPEVPEFRMVVGGCIDREKPFGYRFAIVSLIPADQLDENGEHEDADEFASELAGQPVGLICAYRVDSGTNNETREVLAWLNSNL